MKLFRRKELADNHDKTCVPLNQRSKHGGLTFVGTCSLCGREVELWPCMAKYCPRCLATIDHGAAARVLVWERDA